MKLDKLWYIYGKEILDLLRDRRTIISMIVVPLAMMPLLVLGMNYFVSRSTKKAKAKINKLAIDKEKGLSGIVGELLLESDRIAPAPQKESSSPQGLLSGLMSRMIQQEIVALSMKKAFEDSNFKLVEVESPRQAVIDKKADAGMSLLDSEGELKLEVYADFSNLGGQLAGRGLESVLGTLKVQMVRAKLTQLKISEKVLDPYQVERVNLAPPRKMSGMFLGKMLGYFIVILMLSGGMYPAIDMTAGEKERKTMEMLLSSPASREEIVMGKIMATISATFVTALLSIISFGMSFYVGYWTSDGNNKLFGQMTELPLDLVTVSLLILSILPMAILGSAIIVAISTMAKSYKEAQSYLTPFIMVAIFPAMVSFIPGVKLDFTTALIPIVNFSQLVKELLLGDWTWLGFVVTMVSNCVYALVAFFVAVRMFKSESILFRT